MRASATLPLLLPAAACAPRRAAPAPALGSRAVPLREGGGIRFRGLSRNGAPAPYEDRRRSPLHPTGAGLRC